MNIQWSNMTGFGPIAWNHGGQPLKIPSMAQQHRPHSELVFHPHEASTVRHERTDLFSHNADHNEGS